MAEEPESSSSTLFTSPTKVPPVFSKLPFVSKFACAFTAQRKHTAVNKRQVLRGIFILASDVLTQGFPFGPLEKTVYLATEPSCGPNSLCNEISQDNPSSRLRPSLDFRPSASTLGTSLLLSSMF